MGSFILFWTKLTHTMKLLYPVLSLAAVYAQNEVAPVEDMEPEMSWVDWATETMPGFKATNNYYKYENTDFNIMVKYNFKKNKFEFESPWFTESWAISSGEDMTTYDWEYTMGESMSGNINFKQGMEARTKTNKKGKEKPDGTQWTQVIDFKMQDKSMEDGIMKFKRTINSILDKKNPELWVGTEFQEQWQYGKAKAKMESKVTPKYDSDNMWKSSKTAFKASMDDGNGTVTEMDQEFNAELTKYEQTENSCNAEMTYTAKDKVKDMEWAGVAATQVDDKVHCMFAAEFYMFMAAPFEVPSEDDIKEFLREEHNMMDASDEEIQAKYDYIMAMTNSESGLMQMSESCMVSHQATWPNMETGEEESCDMSLTFRNLLDMAVSKDGQEIIKFTNMQNAENEFLYSVHYMGEQLYTVNVNKYMETVMAKMYEFMSQGYYMYKEHEYYYHEMAAEDFDWMDWVAFMGNWDYPAQKVADMERSMLEGEMAKCDMTVKEHYAMYGVELTEVAETEVLKHYDQEIQFWTWIADNEIDACAYLRQKACESISAMMGWEMEQDKEMVVYPEFVYQERSIAEMNTEVEGACNWHFNYLLDLQAEHSSMLLDGFKSYRDTAVATVQEAVNRITDRAAAEQMIDGEFAKMQEMRDTVWSCEFDIYMWGEHMSYEAMTARSQECLQYISLCDANDESCM